jgi:hypothetical protein
MMRVWLRNALMVVGGSAAIAPAALAQAPAETTVYTRIANWQIARPHWDGYEKDLVKTTVPILDKMLADGVLTEYGVAYNAIHTPEGYSHTTWYSSRTLAGLEKTLAAIVAAESKLPEADQRRGRTDFAGTRHSDALVRSRIIGGRTTRLTSGYLQLAIDTIQPGKGQAFNERYEQLIRPVFAALVADGSVTSFGVDTELVHTNDPAIRSRWVVVPNAEGLDKVDGAMRAANEKRPAQERQALAEAMREIMVSASHRDELWQITSYASKY